MSIIDIIRNILNSNELSTSLIITTLFAATVLSVYEFVVYRFVSKKSLYSKSFNITILTIPYFISTIVLCLQSNMVLTLGTIGALAIIRFRTAIKDPTDMVYLLWSIHTGIMVGCQLYKVAILTSLAATIIILIFTNICLYSQKYTLIVRTKENKEEMVKDILNRYTKKYHIEARNASSEGNDLIIGFNLKDVSALAKELDSNENIVRYSILESNGEETI